MSPVPSEVVQMIFVIEYEQPQTRALHLRARPARPGTIPIRQRTDLTPPNSEAYVAQYRR